jgi:hypothetical protein
MTVEPWSPPAAITIATIAPHGIPFPYQAGAVRAAILNAGVLTQLVPGTDFTVSPAAASVSGNLTLSAPIFAANTGAKLYITRDTVEQQGWLGTAGSREKGLEAQLDGMVQAMQEVALQGQRALRSLDGPLNPFSPQAGKAIIFDAFGQPMNGPTASDIANAQPNAAAAAASQVAAAASAAAAAASAGSVNTTFLQRSNQRCTVGGTANAITLTSSGALSSLVAGMQFRFRPTGTNSIVTPTIKVDGAPIYNCTVEGVVSAMPVGYINPALCEEYVATFTGTVFVVSKSFSFDTVIVGGTSNAITLTSSKFPPLAAGQVFTFVPTAANTALPTVTLSINGSAPLTCYVANSPAQVRDLPASWLLPQRIVTAIYDGSSFQLSWPTERTFVVPTGDVSSGALNFMQSSTGDLRASGRLIMNSSSLSTASGIRFAFVSASTLTIDWSASFSFAATPMAILGPDGYTGTELSSLGVGSLSFRQGNLTNIGAAARPVHVNLAGTWF